MTIITERIESMIQIGCTRKLLDFLGVPVAAKARETDPLFDFSANLILIKRRKCIAVVNNATGCGFVIYGATADNKRDLQEALAAGLQNMLASENYAEDVIRRYLVDCAFPAVICATADRSAAAKMNKFCQRIAYLADFFETDDRFQTILLPLINDGYRTTNKGKGEGFFTFEEQERLFRERYGKLYGVRVGIFDVSLQLETPCVRRVMIPMHFSLFYLHDVIQNLFLWEDCHLHEFILKTSKDGRPRQIASIPDLMDEDVVEFIGCEVLDEREITLDHVFSKTNSVTYVYDFGDEWTHEIRLLKTVDDADVPAPVCMDVTGDAPPEDCGGPWGFSKLLRVLNNPMDPAYDETVQWNGSARIIQKSAQWINSDLRRRYLAGALRLFKIAYDEEPDESF